ncbi:sigma-70 family RNA polymerase sigma factor [Nocardia lijiangensis]|uniref:sigma-70 family RNA polymerase sigma factor n=1 Tax=Nocardia lijiangensis TaxID=299618 RepID=UPI00083490E6|nr:sigma-70 family RNA polymerase sigma factor [Nocardia lijiangensis]
MGTSDTDAVPPDRLSSDLDPIDATAPPPGAADPFGEPDGSVADLVGEAVDALERAQADRALYELAAEHGGTGPVWEHLVEALAEYAWQVLDPWIHRRGIYPVLSRMFVGLEVGTLARERLANDQVHREEVIAHTISRALYKLGKALRTDTGWDPGKGLTLRSYFLNGCLHEFVYVYQKEQRWSGTHTAPIEDSDADELIESGRGALWASGLGRDPADIVTNRIVLLEHLATLRADDRTLLWAHAVGYSHAEIAHLFSDVTPKAIERRLYRLRKLFVRNR